MMRNILAEYVSVTILLQLSILGMSGCDNSNTGEKIKLDCHPTSIAIYSDMADFKITDKLSIHAIEHWLAEVEPVDVSYASVDVSYASYPTPLMTMTLDCIDKNSVKLSMSYPANQTIPQIVEYNGNYFLAPEAPHVKEFNYFRDRFDDNSLEPNR